MNHLKFACLLIPLLTILCFAQRSGDTEFHLVKFVDKTPYIIIISPQIIADVLKSNHSAKANTKQDRQNSQTLPYSLDTTRIQLPEELYLIHGFSYHPRTAQKIIGPRSERNRLINTDYTMQFALPDGSGRQTILKAQSAFYYPIFREGYIIVQCKPIKESPYPADGLLSYLRAIVPTTTSNIPWRKNIPQAPLPEIPKAIQKQAKHLSQDFLSSLENYKKYDKSSVSNMINETTISLRWFDGTKETIYYVAITSYGSKNYNSSLWLRNENGEIVQHILGRRYVRIIGKTDLNRDGSHELTLQYSIGDYSGGIEVLNLEDMGTKHPLLQSKTALEVWWD